MLAKMEQENTDQLAMQQTWVNLACDYRTDSKQANKRMSIVCWVMAAIIAFMAGAGLYFYDVQQTKYLAQIESLTVKVETQQREFLEFLNQYEFSTTSIEQSMDNTQGDITDSGNINTPKKESSEVIGQP